MKLRHEPMPSDVAILSAEQYGTASFGHLSGSVGKPKKTHTAHADHDGPRKRAKTSSVAVVTEVTEDGDGDDKAKRSRGRPRLDTKDQSAADVCTLFLSFGSCRLPSSLCVFVPCALNAYAFSRPSYLSCAPRSSKLEADQL